VVIGLLAPHIWAALLPTIYVMCILPISHVTQDGMRLLQILIVIQTMHLVVYVKNGIIFIGTIAILNVLSVLQPLGHSDGKMGHQDQQQFIQEQMVLQLNAVSFLTSIYINFCYNFSVHL
jgi:hypothetical protein